MDRIRIFSQKGMQVRLPSKFILAMPDYWFPETRPLSWACRRHIKLVDKWKRRQLVWWWILLIVLRVLGFKASVIIGFVVAAWLSHYSRLAGVFGAELIICGCLLTWGWTMDIPTSTNQIHYKRRR